MISKDKKILITGSTGFIGSNLLQKLVELNYKNISILLRENSNINRIEPLIKKVSIYKCELLKKDKLEKILKQIKPDIIYHIAAAGTTGGKDKISFDYLYESNFIGTKNLLDISKEIGFKYFINTGSSSEYGEKNIAMKEDDICNPNNDYGLSKLLATKYCKYIGEKEKLAIYTFRIFSAYGYKEEERRLIPTLINSYINGIIPKLSNPNFVRDYIFIDDIINYYLNIDKLNGDFGGIYNLGSGKQYSIGKVVEIIKKITNSENNPEYGSLIPTQYEPKLWLADMKKTNNAFGLTTLSLEEGLKKLINTYNK